jgi:phosphohistidine swiveling domain-containing protein
MNTQSPLVLPFSAISKHDLPIVGGKGANLGEMTQAGFPVPPGFCVTTAAFEQFITTSEQSEKLYISLARIELNDLEGARQIGQKIRDDLRSIPVPDAVKEAVLTAWQAQGPEKAYAVRSSATAEDLPDASFAGQQDTYLNVRGEEALITAVRDCWISLFTDRAILYRIQNGFDHRQVSLSVVVQQMVMPEISGIMFTADPISGARSITSIDASYGLGEALVAGLVTADLYKVDRRTYTITDVQVADKQLAILPLAEGGTIEKPVTGSARTAQVLSDSQAIILAEIGDRIAKHYGQPQDIEWALTNGKFYILQSRPITSLFPIPEKAFETAEKTGELQVMFSFASVQGVMGPITPLGQDTGKTLFASGGRLFDFNIDRQQQNVVWSGADRLWINITALMRHPIGRKVWLALFPWIDAEAASVLQALQNDPRFKPEPGWFKLKTIRRLSLFYVPLAKRVAAFMRHPDEQAAQSRRETERHIAKVRAQAENAHTLTDRLTLFYGSEGVIPQVFSNLAPRLLPPIVSGMMSLNIVRKLTEGLPPDSPNYLILTRGLPHNVTTEMDLTLWQTAQTIRQDEAATAVFEQQPAAELAASYLAGSLPPAAQTAVSQFMAQYGMRGLGEIDIGQPRWRENPTHIMQVLQSYLQIEDPNLAPDTIFARGAAEAEAAINPMITAVRHTPGGILKAKLMAFFIHRVRMLAGSREAPKFMAIRMMSMAREALLDSGQELTAAGIIKQPDDLFYLTIDELNALAAGKNRDWQAIVEARRERHTREQDRKLIPRLLFSDGQAFYEGVGEKTAVVDDNAISGSPVSPGIVEGIAHIVFNPHDSKLEPGEILVCPGTDPAWTPLFLAAGGLITEVGGLMTHGSVVAREYGIPAVVGVNKATSLIQSGQKIRVDGSRGLITLL